MEKRKSYTLLKWIALVAYVCLAIGIMGLLIIMLNPTSNGEPFGDPNSKLLAAHREDFSSEIDPAILAQFKNPDEVFKTYMLLTNQWVLSDELEDFSQVVTSKVYYIYPGDNAGKDKDIAFSYYEVDENGKIVLDSSVYPSEDALVPQGFWKLTTKMIDTALADLDYDDYIITKSSRIGTVFVWVRSSSGDLFLTYLTRPDLTGLEIGGIYTLEELQEILTEANSL